MTSEELDEIFKLISQPQAAPAVLEFRVYYDDAGKIVTYTTEKLPGQYLVITREQYTEARSDAVVKDGKLLYTHKTTHIGKYTKNVDGIQTSKYDINIICNSDGVWWKYGQHEIW